MNPADHLPVRIVFQPAGLRVDVDPPANLLAAAREAGAGLASECGGKGSCGRCRVRLDAGGAVNPPTDTERNRLGAEGIGAGLRLACQVTACDVVTVTLPPESMTAPQRIQTESLAEVKECDPPTEILDVELPEPSTADPRPDWERLSAGLRDAAGPGSPDILPPGFRYCGSSAGCFARAGGASGRAFAGMDSAGSSQQELPPSALPSTSGQPRSRGGSWISIPERPWLRRGS
jgi:ferredoxin